MGRVGLFKLTLRPRLPIQSRRMFSPCSLAKGGCRLGRVQDVSNPWFALGNVTRSKRSASVTLRGSCAPDVQKGSVADHHRPHHHHAEVFTNSVPEGNSTPEETLIERGSG